MTYAPDLAALLSDVLTDVRELCAAPFPEPAAKVRAIQTTVAMALGGEFPEEAPPAADGTCRSCGAPVRWVTTAAGKQMPLDPARRLVVTGLDGLTHAGYVSHFATCAGRRHK